MDLEQFRFDKVSLNADSCQTAASTISLRISQELELKGLKITYNSQVMKIRITCKKMRKLTNNVRFLFAVHFLRTLSKRKPCKLFQIH